MKYLPTFQYDIETDNPFLEINIIRALSVKVFEDPVHNNLLAQIQIVVQELSEPPSCDLAGVVLIILTK